jgi:hypothetical protein
LDFYDFIKFSSGPSSGSHSSASATFNQPGASLKSRRPQAHASVAAAVAAINQQEQEQRGLLVPPQAAAQLDDSVAEVWFGFFTN